MSIAIDIVNTRRRWEEDHASHRNHVKDGSYHTGRGYRTKGIGPVGRSEHWFLPVVDVAGEVDTKTHQAIVEDIGFKPLVKAEVLVGVITDRDIVVRAIAAGKDTETTAVSEIMTPQVVVYYAHEDMSDAVVAMEQEKVRRLIVLDREGNPVGVLSLDDISVPAPHLSGETLRAITD